MKDIDFLPEWYKSGRRRQIVYRTQCVALVGVFAVMVVWNFAAGRSVSIARGRVVEMASRQAKFTDTAKRYRDLADEFRRLHGDVQTIDQIDSRIDVAGVLGELSFLVDEKIVLRKVELISERLVEKDQVGPSSGRANVVRVVGAKLNDQKQAPVGAVRFKVVLSGVAADSSDVAGLIRKLEDSPYFFQIVPLFSRNIELPVGVHSSADWRAGGPEARARAGKQAGGGGANIRVAEFEISCYLANYREQ